MKAPRAGRLAPPAGLGRDWRVLYEIDDAKHAVIVLGIRRRSFAYRQR
jgi:hypothetical protein